MLLNRFLTTDDNIFSIEEYIKILEKETYLDYFDTIEEADEYAVFLQEHLQLILFQSEILH
jgi:hypothetical protein